MRANEQVYEQAVAWLDAGETLALATIVRIKGSSSQPLGTRMVIASENRFAGEVSGGCVESDVYEAAQDVLQDAAPLMLHYKKVEDPLVQIGLNCDGQIDVLVEPLTRDLYTLLANSGERVNVTLCEPNQPLAPHPLHAQVMPGGEVLGAALPGAVVDDALAALQGDKPVSITYPDDRVALLEPIVPPPLLLIFGASERAVPLVKFAKIMGFHVVVSDARAAFATRERYPDADDVIAAWPKDVIAQMGVDHRTYVVSLNHEPRFEDAMLHALVGCNVAYIGAVGKRTRIAEREARAQEAGFDLTQLPPIHTPIGLNLGGKSPEEIALSVIAQIIAVKNGRPA